MLHTRNTCIADLQVGRQIFRAPANVSVSHRFNVRSDDARTVSVAHGFKIRLNICVAIQIFGVEVYASTALHSTEDGALNDDYGFRWTSGYVPHPMAYFSGYCCMEQFPIKVLNIDPLFSHGDSTKASRQSAQP